MTRSAYHSTATDPALPIYFFGDMGKQNELLTDDFLFRMANRLRRGHPHATEPQKIELAAGLLRGKAQQWWGRAIADLTPHEFNQISHSWETFQAALTEYFPVPLGSQDAFWGCPQALYNKSATGFLMLEQNLSMQERPVPREKAMIRRAYRKFRGPARLWWVNLPFERSAIELNLVYHSWDIFSGELQMAFPISVTAATPQLRTWMPASKKRVGWLATEQDDTETSGAFAERVFNEAMVFFATCPKAGSASQPSLRTKIIQAVVLRGLAAPEDTLCIQMHMDAGSSIATAIAALHHKTACRTNNRPTHRTPPRYEDVEMGMGGSLSTDIHAPWYAASAPARMVITPPAGGEIFAVKSRPLPPPQVLCGGPPPYPARTGRLSAAMTARVLAEATLPQNMVISNPASPTKPSATSPLARATISIFPVPVKVVSPWEQTKTTPPKGTSDSMNISGSTTDSSPDARAPLASPERDSLSGESSDQPLPTLTSSSEAEMEMTEA